MPLPFRASQFVCVFRVTLLTFWEKQLPHCSSTGLVMALSVSSVMLTTQIILHWSTAVMGCQVVPQLLWAHLASPTFPCDCDGSGQHGTAGVLSVGVFWSLLAWKGLERCGVKSVKLLRGLRQLIGWTLREILRSEFFILHWLTHPHMMGEGTLYCLVLGIVSLWFVNLDIFPLGAVDQWSRLKFLGRIFAGLSCIPLGNTVFCSDLYMFKVTFTTFVAVKKFVLDEVLLPVSLETRTAMSRNSWGVRRSFWPHSWIFQHSCNAHRAGLSGAWKEICKLLHPCHTPGWWCLF